MNLISINFRVIFLIAFLSLSFCEAPYFNEYGELTDDFDDENSEDSFDFVEDAQKSKPTCGKDEFQCSKSLECIEKYKFCDRVVDCNDSSDEITCGFLDFSSPSLGPKDFGGWTNVDNGWSRKKTYLTTGVNKDSKLKNVILTFNMHAVATTCVVLVKTNIFTKKNRTDVNTEISVYSLRDGENYPSGSRYTYLWLEKGKNITEFLFGIGDTHKEMNARAEMTNYKINITAKLDVGDELRIYGIKFQDCNLHRTLGDCDFEMNDLCRWKTDKSVSTLKWSIESGNISTKSPIVDHTKGIPKGHYLFVEVRKEDIQNKTTSGQAVLTSDVINFPSCLSFWYFATNSMYSEIQVLLSDRSSDEKWTLKSSLVIDKLEEWNYLEVDLTIPYVFEYFIHIMAKISDTDAAIAIDDILLKNGACKKQHRICTFENDNCGFIINDPIDETNTIWKRVNGNQIKKISGLTVTDHTTDSSTGYMMMFMPNGTKDMSLLSGPYWADAGYRCLSFYYLITDDNIAQLEVVYHHNEDFGVTSWTKEYGYLQRKEGTVSIGGWLQAQLTLSSLDDSRYEFIATSLTTDLNSGFLALDDISITNGKCKTLLSCDFELDDCGWKIERELSSGFFERISSKRKIDGCKPPKVDHTLNSERGHYLFFGFNNPSQEITSIQSKDFNLDKTYCLSFWMLFSAQTTIRVDVYTLGREGSTQLASFDNKKNITGWIYKELNVDNPNSAVPTEVTRILITATPFDYIYGQSVAIDDIQFSPFKCGYKPTNPDDDIEPQKESKRIELPDFRCDFEGNLCEFKNINSNGFNWTIVQAQPEALRRGGPLVDHTLHSFYGKYLTLNPLKNDKNTFKKPYSATLMSKLSINETMNGLNDTINDVCIEFWYVLDGESVSTINLTIAYNLTDTRISLFEKTQTFGPTWRHEYVSFRFYDDFHIFFEATTRDPSRGIVALDDIAVYAGKCPPLDNGICDFANDFCGWDNNVTLPLQFKIVAPYLSKYYAIQNGQNFSTILKYDRYSSEYGKYLFLNVSYPDSEKRKAQFLSPVLTPEKRCLQFYYYFYNQYVGSLKVYVLYNKLDNLKYLIATIPRKDLEFWLFRQVELEKHYLDMDFQFVIEFERSNMTFIEDRFGLDSLEIRDSCTPVVSCDFEDGMCQFYSSSVGFDIDQGFWVRAYGASDWHKGPSFLAPPGDHTVGRDGVFVYVDQEPAAILVTTLFEISQNSCLTFWYYMNSTESAENHKELDLRLHIQLIGLDLFSPAILAQINYTTYLKDLSYQGKGAYWAKRSVTIDVLSQQAILQIIGSVSNKQKHFMALDDISWTDGACDKPKYKKFACVDNPKGQNDFRPQSAVCNFVKDCPNGRDEENCGYFCDFKKDFCGWKVKKVTSTFVRRIEMNLFDGNASILELESLSGIFHENPEAILESPWMQNSGALCGLNMDYIVSDPTDQSAELIVKIIEDNNPVGIEIYRKIGDQGPSWTGTLLRFGRIKRRFKIQIIAKLRIKLGKGRIALRKFEINPTQCLSPSQFHASEFECDSKRNKYKCNPSLSESACYSDNELCDFVEDCPNGTDESPNLCSKPDRTSLACDFEEGICDWSLSTKSKEKNGFKWAKVEDVDDYTYGIKRDHTLNNQFGHVIYVWNKEKHNGTLTSPMIYGTNDCTIRFYYAFTTLSDFSMSGHPRIGTLRLFVKYSQNGRLYEMRRISYFNYHYFQRISHKFDDNYKGAPFYVVIHVETSQEQHGMWAIDDISFSSGCLSKDVHDYTTDTSFTPYKITTKSPIVSCVYGFKCDNSRKCILKKQVCDFNYDCDDGTDEDFCGKDDFKTGWKDKSQGRVYWKYENDTLKSEIRSGDGSVAEMISTLFGESYSKCTLNFEYFIESKTEYIQITLLHESDTVVELAKLFDSRHAQALNYGKWNKANVYIGDQDPNWYLRLTGTKTIANDKVQTMMIRNFHIHHCDSESAHDWTACRDKGLFTCATIGCVSMDQVCDFSADCEDGSDEKNCKKMSSFMCSFEGQNGNSKHKNNSSRVINSYSTVNGPTCQLKMSNLGRFTGRDVSGFFGPGLDHTTDSENGHFLMTQNAQSATVNMPILEPTSDGNCNFRFWYMMDGDASITIQNTVFNPGQMKTVDYLNSKDVNDSFIWRRYETTLLSKYEFQLSLVPKVQNPNETKSFVAIDDISFSSSCKIHHGKVITNLTTPGNVNNNCIDDEEFACQDGITCLPLEFVCDFYPNCANGEDESLCPKKCTFDDPMDDPTCGWGESPSDNNPGMMNATIENSNSASVLTKYYPDRDATLGTQTGYFMLIYPFNFTNKVDSKLSLNVYSAEYSSSSPECTFEMKYYISALDEDKKKPTATYSISVIYDTLDGAYVDTLYNVDSGDSSLWNKWIHIMVGIGKRDHTWQIMVSRSNDSYMAESFAIDDLIFTNCAYTPPHLLKKKDDPIPECSNAYTCFKYYNCIPYDQMCDNKMDCPLGDDEANCKEYSSTFEKSTNNKFIIEKFVKKNQGWQKISGPASEKSLTNAGPPFDHTFFNKSGHYLYGRSFNAQDLSSYIISPTLKKMGSPCQLRFFYFMNKYLNDSIKIYTKKEKQNRQFIKEIRSNLTDKWLQAVIDLESYMKDLPFKVELQGTGLDKSSIGIDDISFSETCTGGLPYTGLVTTSTSPTKKDTPASEGITTETTTPTATTITTTTENNDQTDSPTPETTTIAPKSQCSAGEFWCKADSTCLPVYTKCNFVNDCSDGSDESPPMCTQAQCVFTSPNIGKDCGLSIFATNSGYNWTWTTWKKFSSNAGQLNINALVPEKFFYVNQTAAASFAPASISTRLITETGHACSLRFYYICDPRNCPIQVSQANYGPNNSGNEKVIWIPLDDRIDDSYAGYIMEEANIFIGKQTNFIISITSMHHYGSTGYVLLDSITFVNCENAQYNYPPFTKECDSRKEFQCYKSYGNCISKEAVCDYEHDCRLAEDEKKCDNFIGRCDFENIVNCFFWEYENDDQRWSWIIESGLSGLPYLPRVDHTAYKEENYYFSFHSSIMKNYVNNKAKFFSTSFKSDIFAKNVTSECRLRIWHNLIGKNCTLNIYKRYSSNNMIRLLKIDSDFDDFWIKADLNLDESKNNEPQDFDVIIEAKVGIEHKCSVNMDDLSMTPECYLTGNTNFPDEAPNDDLKNLCRPNLMCHSKQCYSKDQICNFIEECSDGTDEEGCISSCDFDDLIYGAPALCGWYVPRSFQGNFENTDAKSAASASNYRGPKVDHTSGKREGHFLKTIKFMSENQKLELHSPLFQHSSKNCRFSFAAFFEDFKKTKMKIFLKNPYKLIQVWPKQQKLNKDDIEKFDHKWGVDDIPIGKQDNFSIVFELIHSDSYLDNNVFFDDFIFHDCATNVTNDNLVCQVDEYHCDDESACIPYFKICDGQDDCKDSSDEKHCIQTNGTCWFSDENWKTHCNWIDLDKDFTWTWMDKPMSQSDEHETGTGPQELLNDKYNYLLMNAKKHNFSQRAAVATQEFPASNGICLLNFHYYMYGAPSMGELFVYSLGSKTGKRSEIFRRNHPTGASWSFENDLMISSPNEPFKVVFEAMVGGNEYTDIAIAYVSFSKDCAAGKWMHSARNGNLTDFDTCEGFYCHKSHECIPRDWVCDGEIDCRDGSDEINCANVVHHSGKHSGRVAAISISIFGGICLVSIVSVFIYRRIITSDSNNNPTGNPKLYRRFTRRNIRSPISIEMSSRS